jgi:phenylalanyl-tRNA synthetase alpha chain
MSQLITKHPTPGRYLPPAELTAALAVRDLTDPEQGPHAIQLILDAIVTAVAHDCGVPVIEHRTPALVATADNYDRLGYAPDDITRDARYSRHVSPTVMLRSHTTAGIPAVLDRLRDAPADHDQVVALPGLVYRRDSIDRTHVGTPHQLDVWRLSRRRRLGVDDLHQLARTVVTAVLPGARWRVIPAVHPYTSHGLQVEVSIGGEWLELAECGLAGRTVLTHSDLDPTEWSGLALGLGLDRALMIRKGIDDIRLLRSNHPEVVRQLLDLEPWRPVSVMPAIRRDISIVADDAADPELLGDLARTALGPDADLLADLTVLADTSAADLPAGAATRLRIRPGQHNLLIRLTWQALDRTLTDAEANCLRDRVYRALHHGPVLELIAS